MPLRRCRRLGAPNCTGAHGIIFTGSRVKSKYGMNPERWKRIKEILDIALRLPPAEREAYLTRVCEDDAELRAEVNSLLEAQEAAGDFLEKPLFQEPADPVLGARLGAYQVVELIGNGGMGSVYRAVRVDEAFHKEVAIKVVQRGVDLDRVVRQFRR